MTYLSKNNAIKYLKNFLTNNKARGMAAEIDLDSYLAKKNALYKRKFFSGAWLLSPKTNNFYEYRHAVFVLPKLYKNIEDIENTIDTYQKDRGFQELATFLSSSGIAVVVSGALNSHGTNDIGNISWRNFLYLKEDETLHPSDELFENWNGKGRASTKNNKWEDDVCKRLNAATVKQITSLTLRQAFYYNYLKHNLKKSVADPYDVDAFLVSYRCAVLPVEVKEKSSTEKRQFGLDAGRILMMLRLCIATDSNGLYIIREVTKDEERTFSQWRYITLSNLIMGCSWNLQAGGTGMKGGSTQTVMIEGSLFKEFTEEVLSEDWLDQNSRLQKTARDIAGNFAKSLSEFLRSNRA